VSVGGHSDHPEMVSRYIHIRDWVVILVVQLCLVGCSADYFWDGNEWRWQDTPKVDDVDEGSGDDVYGGHPLYRHDDDEEDEGSGHIRDHDYDEHEEEDEQDAVDNDIVNVDDEIDPRDLDIGFHEDITEAPDKATSSKSTTSKTVPNAATELSDPSKHEFSQETNFFAQPGIMTAVIGGTVVGLLCTILLVMFIVYRMRKADEGSYSLNEPKRSPNVHSYLKAPSREFFA